jgi:hypothetical protein
MYPTKIERAKYNQRRNRICQELEITKNHYNWLRHKGEKLRRLYEQDCNGKAEPEQVFVEKALYKRIDAYVKDLGLFIYYQTDPRGATIYVDKKEIPENNYTQAYCIY